MILIVYITFILFGLHFCGSKYSPAPNIWSGYTRSFSKTPIYLYERRSFQKPYSIYNRRPTGSLSWQHEAPVLSSHTEIYDLIHNRKADPLFNTDESISPSQERLPDPDMQRRMWMHSNYAQLPTPDSNHMTTSMSRPSRAFRMPNLDNFAIHQVPGFEYSDRNGRPAQDDALEYRPANVKPPRSSLVWNEEGKFWGYAKTDHGLMLRPQDYPSQTSNYPTYSNYDDGSCIPPFCIPVMCNDSEKKETCKGSCCKQLCDPPCLNGGACRNQTCSCPPGFLGPQCQAFTTTLCRQIHALDCFFGCAANEPSNKFLCICRPWKVEDISNCTSVGIESFACPEGCNDRGRCDIKTRKCHCNEPYSGLACESQDYCKASNLMPCEYKCLNTPEGRHCICPRGASLNTDGYSCSMGQSKCPHGTTGERCELDIDECLTGTHDCEQICKNVFGGYECSCNPGFTVNPVNARSCIRHGCDPQCIAEQGICTAQNICKCLNGFK
ncbi:unnamed protein product, partial [Protopolystoma xenopodis]